MNNTFSLIESHNQNNLLKPVSSNPANQPRLSNFNLCKKETDKENKLKDVQEIENLFKAFKTSKNSKLKRLDGPKTNHAKHNVLSNFNIENTVCSKNILTKTDSYSKINPKEMNVFIKRKNSDERYDLNQNISEIKKNN